MLSLSLKYFSTPGLTLKTSSHGLMGFDEQGLVAEIRLTEKHPKPFFIRLLLKQVVISGTNPATIFLL